METKNLLFKTSSLLLFLLFVGWSSAGWGQTTVTLTKADNTESPWVVPPGVNEITVKIWGAGGGSGGHGSTAGPGGNGGATTFSGPGANLTAGGGEGSLGATNNTLTLGGVGGSATGGTFNLSGANGELGVAGNNNSTGGDGGSSPNGGGTQNGPNIRGNGNSIEGLPGNPPGGGAAGSARSANQTADRRATGGGGGGAYSEITISVTPGQEFVYEVGAGGNAGTGDQAAGGAGADGQIEITYTEAACIPPLAPTSGGDQSECAGVPIQTLTATATAPVGASVVWFDQAVGGNIVSEPTLNAIGFVTYYAESQLDDDATCVSESRTAVTLTLIEVPQIDDPEDVTACDSFILPALTVGGAYFASSGGDDPVAVGTEITSTQTIFVYAETGTTPNCWAENSFLVTINASPELDLIKTDVLCHGESSGTITADWSGGADPYTVFLNGVERSSGVGSGPYEITGLVAGTYTVKVEDANGCFDEKTIEITQPDQLVAGTLSSSQEICLGETPATLTATAPTGGSHADNLSYEWQYKFAFLSPEIDWTVDGNITTQLVYDFAFTTAPTQTTHYRLKITDTHCDPPQVVYTNEITITVNPLPEAPSAVNVTVTYDGAEHEAIATVGVGEVVDWYNAATEGNLIAAPTGTNVGIYSAWAEARNQTTGCVSTDRTKVTLEVTVRPLEITADSDSKVYDGTALTNAGYSITDGTLADGQTLDAVTVTGSQTDVGSSDNVPSAAVITDADDVDVTSNYDITYVEGTLEVTVRPLEITADSDSKIYGEVYSFNNTEYTLTNSTSLAGGQNMTLVLSSMGAFASATTGAFDINISDVVILDASNTDVTSNYDISPVKGTLTVNSRPITITVNAGQTKVYGEDDPHFTYIYDGDDHPGMGLAPSDTFTGALERVLGEVEGSYAINIGDLSIVDQADEEINKESNYSITFIPNDFTITKRPITITVDAGQTKVYGEDDPPLTYTSDNPGMGLAPWDKFTGDLVRDPGETVGSYAISKGTLLIVDEDDNTIDKESNYTITFVGDDFTITQAPVDAVVIVDPTTVQYSDLVTFTAIIEGGAPLVTDGPQAAVSATFKVEDLEMGTADFVVVGDDIIAVLSEVPMIEPYFGEGTMEPGSKTVSAIINGVDDNYAVNPNPATTNLTITQEDALIEYVGLQLIATESSSSSSANATLRVVIQDNSVTDPDDNWPGDIRNATVQFKVYDVDANNFTESAGSPSPWIAVSEMLTVGDYTTGVVSWDYTFNIGNNDSKSFGVEVIVNNYYKGTIEKEDLMVTVYKPQGDFITGGGYIMPQNPDPTVGLYPSDPGSRTNFGFNVKFNPAGRNLKGRLNFIWRTEGGRILQARSNAIESLGVNIFDPEDKVAVFAAKCNVRDISENNTNLPNSGGLLMYVTMRDRGEPGNMDVIGFTLWNGNELWYSSNWTGMSTGELYLGGGNLVVHSGFNLGETSKILDDFVQSIGIERISGDLPGDDMLTDLSGLTVFPNPFTDRLNFRFMADASERALIELYDLTGSRIAVVFDEYVSEGQVYEVEYRPQIHNTTVVFYRMILGNRVTNGKLIYKE